MLGNDSHLPLSPQNSTRDRLIVLGLVALALACYWPLAKFDFINYDDPRYVTTNLVIQRGLSWDGFVYSLYSADGGYWHPLTWWTHMLDVQLFGLHPGGHHVTSLLIHTTNTVLLWWLLKRLTGSVWPSVWVAAMFSIHPVHLESVAWIAERKDLLSGFFFLLTLLAYLRYTEQRTWRRYFIVTLSLAAALASKPMTVTTPAVLILLDVWPLRRIRFDRPGLRSIVSSVLEKGLWLAMSFAVGVVTILSTRSVNTYLSTDQIPLSWRLETSIVGYLRYIGKLVWPTRLLIFYPYVYGWSAAWLCSAVVVIGGITAAVIWQLKPRPFLAMGWFWFLGVLLPVVGIFYVGDASLADRYTYLPAIGVFIAVAWGVTSLPRVPRKLKAIVGAGTVLACAVATSVHVWDWRDTLSIMGHVARIDPDNWTGNLNYGAALCAVDRESEAGPYLLRAVTEEPRLVVTNTSYAGYLLDRNEIDLAMKYTAAAGQLNPNDPAYLVVQARVLEIRGQMTEALALLDQALARSPRDLDALTESASCLAKLGQIGLAEQRLRRALEIDSNSAFAEHSLGLILAAQGQAEEAIQSFARAVQLKPGWGIAHLDYGVMLAKLQRLDEAKRELESASRLLQPNKPAQAALAETTLGQVLEQAQQPAEAYSHYSAAIELMRQIAMARPNDPVARYQLAITLLQARQPEAARTVAREAMQMASQSGNRWLMGELHKWFGDLTAADPINTPPKAN